MNPSSPLEAIRSAPPDERRRRAFDDDFLFWASGLDDLALQRVRQELSSMGACPQGWWPTVRRLRMTKPTTAGEDTAWRQKLRSGEGGKYLCSPYNLELITTNWPPLATLRLNELTLEAEINDKPLSAGATHFWAARIEETFGMPIGLDKLDAAFEATAESRAYHPHRDRLDALMWDGKDRIPIIARDLLDNAEPLSWRMMECLLFAACARTYEPGSKADTMPTLFSPGQGLRKTTFLKRLFYDSAFIGHIDLANKDTIMNASTRLICIADEVDQLTNRTDWPAFKQWLSQEDDIFRAPYARRPRKWPRRFVFGATTNKKTILQDDSESRRWHIITVGPEGKETRIDRLEEHRDQIWAEAAAKYREGLDDHGRPRPYLWWMTPEEEAARENAATAYQEFGIVDEKIAAYVTTVIGEFRMQDLLTSGLGVPPDKVNEKQGLENKAARVLAKLGWKSVQVWEGEGRERKQRRVWRRKTEEDR